MNVVVLVVGLVVVLVVLEDIATDTQVYLFKKVNLSGEGLCDKEGMAG